VGSHGLLRTWGSPEWNDLIEPLTPFFCYPRRGLVAEIAADPEVRWRPLRFPFGIHHHMLLQTIFTIVPLSSLHAARLLFISLQKAKPFTQVCMNLPASALEFLDVFQ
jgi:hypothetical protein